MKHFSIQVVKKVKIVCFSLGINRYTYLYSYIGIFTQSHFDCRKFSNYFIPFRRLTSLNANNFSIVIVNSWIDPFHICF